MANGHYPLAGSPAKEPLTQIVDYFNGNGKEELFHTIACFIASEWANVLCYAVLITLSQILNE